MTTSTVPVARFRETPLDAVEIDDPFWTPRLTMNREDAIFYQWEQLERTHTIDNFRIVAGSLQGRRRGFPYSDSDAFKWVEAAACILATGKADRLQSLVEDFVEILVQAQAPDGYLFTYNQSHFPGLRWQNLYLEHELYCTGHLLEAAVALHQATGDEHLLRVGIRASRLLVKDFQNAPPSRTPGHQEVEIGLLRLYQVTGEEDFLQLACHFLEQRGRTSLYGARLAAQVLSMARRARAIAKQRPSEEQDEIGMGFDLSENRRKREPPFLGVRTFLAFWTGRFQQQNKPIREAREPVGHAVRWTYQCVAATRMAVETGDATLLETLRTSWEHMVTRRMYVTGGIGSLPVIEGFGRDYELDNEFSYCETCAALGSVFWNWEMLQATAEAPFADLIEWQLFNAAAVGIGQDGHGYLYRNPLKSTGDLQRRPWFNTACCPSNVSRTWASLGKYLASRHQKELWVHQYVGGRVRLEGSPDVELQLRSELPWDGRVSIDLSVAHATEFTVHLRIPSWTESPRVVVAGDPVQCPQPTTAVPTASGYSPHSASYLSIRRRWEGTARIDLHFPMPVRLRKSDARVRGNRGHVALTRGPLVYCLESCDNVDVPVPEAEINVANAPSVESSDLFGGIRVLEAKSDRGDTLTLLPYFLWANRDPSTMQVWIRSHSGSSREP